MKTLIAMVMACTLGACGSLDAAPAADDKLASCQTLEAATGSNRLTRQACTTTDPAEVDANRAAAEALQRDQIQRALPRPGQPGAK
jgi:hypothetical protein